MGGKIVKRALEEPMRWIAANAGHQGTIVINKVRDMDTDHGFNAVTGTYENLVTSGVIDPTKVVRYALQNAASIAGLLLTTEALVSELPEEEGEGEGAGAPAAPHGIGHY